MRTIRKTALAVLLAILFPVAVWAGATDSCAAGAVPCTLPCTATSTPSKILDANGKRTDLFVANTGTANTLYVIIGCGALTSSCVGSSYLYGIPVAPGQNLDLQVQPDPTKALHTYTSQVWIATSVSTTTCVFAELAQ